MKMMKLNEANPAKSFCQDEIQRQLTHMTAFIDQEADEKVSELDAKAEEEYNIEKGKITNAERIKILDFYAKKEKNINIQRKIQNSNYNNRLRLHILATREQHIDQVVEDTRKVLGSIAEDHQKYLIVLRQLILQGALQFLKSNVTIRTRKEDVDIAKSVIESVSNEFRVITGKDCKFTVDESNFLKADSCGGVILYAQNERLKIVNTLNSRLTLITSQVTPSIRTALFGDNPNRKFVD